MSDQQREDALDRTLSGQNSKDRLIDSVAAMIAGQAYDLMLSHSISGEWPESEAHVKAEHDMMLGMVGEMRKLKSSVPEISDSSDHIADANKMVAISDLIAERQRQNEKWGGPHHDDQHQPGFWTQLIQDYAGWARVMAGMDSPEKYRKRMVQVAALAVAAIEVLDRVGGDDE